MRISDAKFKINSFKNHLELEQKKQKTVKTYLRAVALFFEFAEEKQAKRINDSILLEFKDYLTNSFVSSTANTYIIGFNAFSSFLRYRGIRIKCIKRQSRDYVSFPLIDAEYNRLIKAAKEMRGNTYMLLKTLAGTGIRVGELKFITVEAVKNGFTEIKNKGKTRLLYLNSSLCTLLLDYCEENLISKGVVFTGKDGNSPLSPSAIWRKINNLTEKTNIDKKKLHPHNLRHYYASRFMRIVNDLNVLKDLLGHSDIKTTAIYLHPDGDYIRKCVNKTVA